VTGWKRLSSLNNRHHRRKRATSLPGNLFYDSPPRGLFGKSPEFRSSEPRETRFPAGDRRPFETPGRVGVNWRPLLPTWPLTANPSLEFHGVDYRGARIWFVRRSAGSRDEFPGSGLFSRGKLLDRLANHSSIEGCGSTAFILTVAKVHVLRRDILNCQRMIDGRRGQWSFMDDAQQPGGDPERGDGVSDTRLIETLPNFPPMAAETWIYRNQIGILRPVPSWQWRLFRRVLTGYIT